MNQWQRAMSLTMRTQISSRAPKNIAALCEKILYASRTKLLHLRVAVGYAKRRSE
jgi:hypothetical protein